MVHNRWYPTVLTLGDQRIANSHEILVVCGHGSGDMEIYDEASDSFAEVTLGDDKPFPNLYPGLHLLPNPTIFYSRTGWASAGAGGGPFTAMTNLVISYLQEPIRASGMTSHPSRPPCRTGQKACPSC